MSETVEWRDRLQEACKRLDGMLEESKHHSGPMWFIPGYIRDLEKAIEFAKNPD